MLTSLLIFSILLCTFPCASGLAQTGSAPDPARDALRAARILETALGPEPSAAALESMDSTWVRLVAEYPGSIPVRQSCGLYRMSRRDPDGAFLQWTEAEALDPSNPETASLLGGYYLGVRADIPTAAGYHEKAVFFDPDSARYHFELANVLHLFRREAGKPGETQEQTLRRALDHFRSAAALAPHNADYARAYAETFYLIPDADWLEAFRAWERATSLMPDKDFGRLHLARVSLRLGQPDQASAYLDLIPDGINSKLRDKLRTQARDSKSKQTPDKPQ